ncbi:NGFI-A-binding protein 2 [Struthio camelus]|uniref:NGFI-A-binding protein 2 n=1 Tax=Struthio camelus TaxID=8801 RepID=UPI003603CE38
MALPRTLGELQLYRVLQRANLLGYYETFIQQGGDDVQQLCEAGEEEFLEIMALVGMATKPLHVRRLQKALREWASNPGLFSQPVPALPVSSIPLFKLAEPGGRKALSNGHASPGEAAGKAAGGAGTPPARSPAEPAEKLSPSAAPPSWPGRSTPESEGGGDEEPAAPPFSPGGEPAAAGAEALEPELARTVAESVERLLQSCPRGGGDAELRALMKLNKKLAKAVGHIFQMDDGDRQKEEEIRRHSAIYGRGEARRRDGKQLSLHELIINEAAAQFCLRDPSLLLRRVELFSLSRQVARESTYLSSLRGARALPDDGAAAPAAKRLKQEAGEQSRPPEPPAAPHRAGLDEDAADSPDGHARAAAACPRLTPPPPAAELGPGPGLPPHGLWSRHLLQQTLMDEGLRLARLVSHERAGGRSPCPPGKAPAADFEDGLAERRPPAPPEPPRGAVKVEQETGRQ